MQKLRLLTWAQGFYVAGLALGLLFIIPSDWFPLQLAKIAFASVLLFIAAVLYVLDGGASALMRGRSIGAIALAAVLPVVYLLSYFFSIDKALGVAGNAADADTLLFVTLLFGAFVLALGLFRSAWSVRLLLRGVSCVIALAALLQYLIIVSSPSMLPAVFSDRSVNLIGKWNDLGLSTGFLLLFLLLAYEFGGLTRARAIVASVGMALCALLLALVNFPLAWILLLVFSIAIALWSFVSRRAADTGGSLMRVVPWMPLVVSAVALVLVLWGTVVNTGLTNVFPVSSLEVRPSYTSTVAIEKAAHGSSFGRFLLGTGPQTFGEEWLMHKPASVNASPFWSLDFTVGYSSLLTVLGSTGLLGVIGWLIPFFLVLLALVYILRSAHFTAHERLSAAYLGLGSIFLWSGLLLYVPSQILILAAFALGGSTVGFALSKRDNVERAHTHVTTALSWAAAVVLIVLLGWSTLGINRRFIAEAYTNQGLLALQQGNADNALSLAAKSQAIDKSGDNLRLSTDAGFAKLQQMAAAADPSSATQDQVQAFAVAAQQAIPLGQQAIAWDPQDYRSYISLGQIYDLLASLKVQGAYENAKAAYDAAASHNPTNPQIPLLLARLEAGQGNLQGVQTNLSQSLTLKQDYTDAILFVVQLDVAQKDMPNAIKAATAAVQSAPGVASIWFELGLLYYSAGDTTDAIAPLEQAVKLQSDYANAKYFLGLSYAAQNRSQDAIQQFLDLQKTNSDNQEVQLILSNLETGKQPFAGAQPPVTATPQNRTAAPISQ
jgi:tetratricopeptide (TPR) repeat protein